MRRRSGSFIERLFSAAAEFQLLPAWPCNMRRQRYAGMNPAHIGRIQVSSTVSQMSEATSDAPNAAGERRAPQVAVWQSVRKYWITTAVTVIAVFLGVVFYTLGQKRIYEAQATIMFDPNPPRPLGSRVESIVDLGNSNYWGNQEYYETQYQLIRSRRVALAVVRDLGLQNDQGFLQNLAPGEAPVRSLEMTEDGAAIVVQSRVKVEPVRDSRLAIVTLRDADPARAQRVLATLVESYTSQNLENAMESTSSATAWLQKQLDALKTDLESSELALHEYRKHNDILSVNFDEKSSMLSAQMQQINAALTDARAELQRVAARRSVLNGVPADDPTAVQATELLQSSLLNSLRGEYAAAVREREAMLGRNKGKNHPDVAAAERRVKAAEGAILKEIQNVQRAVDRDVAAVGREVAGLQAMLDEAKKQAHELNLLEIEHNRLFRSKQNTEKLYSLVLERTKEADLSQMMRVNNISVVDAPIEPKLPVHPRVPQNLAVGLLLGLLLGGVAAFARGLFDRTVKVPDELEAELGLTCLGLLPELTGSSQQPSYYTRGKRRHRGKRLAAQGVPELVVHDAPTSTIAEAARTIRTNLMFMAPDEPFRSLLVTSAGPYEGKTTVACCIAVAMAQAGQNVLLIDCDLRRPRVHRVFGLDIESGVTTALLDGNLLGAVHETVVPRLSVMVSGPIPPNPAELFHTEKFRRLLAEARSSFDRVIIDSPPVAAVTDPAVLSTEVDATVLVVRAFKTQKEVVRHATRAITSVGGRIAGAVLNAVDFSKMEYRYAYHYYRRDEYYGVPKGPSDGDRPSEAQLPS